MAKRNQHAKHEYGPEEIKSVEPNDRRFKISVLNADIGGGKVALVKGVCVLWLKPIMNLFVTMLLK